MHGRRKARLLLNIFDGLSLTLMFPFVAKFGEASSLGRSLARWSARLLAASFLVIGLSPVTTPPANIFDSLANQLRDATICAARAPRWLAIAGLLFAYLQIRGALWSAIGQQFTDLQQGNFFEKRRMLGEHRRMIYGIWKAPDFRLLRLLLMWGALLLAILSGVVSVLIAALVLPVMSSFWSWVFIVVVSFAVTQLEKLGTERIYARAAPKPKPPNQAEALTRLATYNAIYPEEATAASPLLFAYSALDRDQVGQRFFELGAGPVSIAPRLIAIVLTAAIYPHIPAPNVEPLGQAGFIGCTYTDLYGFFRLTQENLLLAIAAAGLVLAVSPFTVLLAYVLFMIEWRFPLRVQFEVLRREWGFAARMMAYKPLMAIGSAIFIMAQLWISAWLATRLNSPLAGLVVLLTPLVLALVFRKRIVG